MVGQIFTSRHQHYDPQRRENDKFSFIESESICFSKHTIRVTKKKKKKSTAALWFMCELSHSGSRLSTLGLQQVVQFEEGVAPLGGQVLPDG